jgi:hypothetical protein
MIRTLNPLAIVCAGLCFALMACESDREQPTGSPMDLVAWEPGIEPQTPCSGKRHSVEHGDECSCAEECKDGAICVPERAGGPPGHACLRTCVSQSDCPAGNKCGVGLCRPSCTNSSDCREGQRCSGGTCLTGCSTDRQCKSGHCNIDRGACDDGEGRRLKGLLEVCFQSEECKSGLCSADSGRCLSFCATDRPACPGDAICISLQRGVDGICLPPCTTDTDCGDLHCEDWPSGELTCSPTRGLSCGSRAAELSKIGGPCRCADECPSGSVCSDEAASQVPQGICRRDCELPDGVEWAKSDQCGGDEYVCALTQDTWDGACQHTCRNAEDCPPARICSRHEGCKPFCLADSDCIEGTCDPYLGWCGRSVDLTEGAIGSSCKAGCRGFCRESTTGSVCSSLCSISRDICPDDAICVDDRDDDDLGFCAKPCSTNEDCGDDGISCTEGDPRYCGAAQ